MRNSAPPRPEEGGGAPKEHLAKTKQRRRSRSAPRGLSGPIPSRFPHRRIKPKRSSGFKAAHRDRPVVVPVGRSSRGLPGKRRSGKPAQPRGPPALPMELRCTTDPPVKSGRRDIAQGSDACEYVPIHVFVGLTCLIILGQRSESRQSARSSTAPQMQDWRLVIAGSSGVASLPRG